MTTNWPILGCRERKLGSRATCLFGDRDRHAPVMGSSILMGAFMPMGIKGAFAASDSSTRGSGRPPPSAVASHIWCRHQTSALDEARLALGDARRLRIGASAR